ncbi:MAG: histone deacetylase family protein [Desulfurococcaceae archaeon]
MQLLEVIFVREATFMHKPISDHPENPYRVVKARSSLNTSGLKYRDVSIEKIDREEAIRVCFKVHSRRYVEYLLELSRKTPVLIDEDTYMSENSLDLALATMYLSYVHASNQGKVFLVSRPPGHHAGVNGRAMSAPTQGFCLLNNAAAAVHGFMETGLKRILVLDFDAHHGNGTMEIFYRDRILQVDLHQDPDTLYPHTGYPDEVGEGEGYGYKANIVLPPGSGDDVFVEVLGLISDLAEKYSPEAVVVSAGFDGFENDGLADLNLTEKSYYTLGLLVRGLNAPTLVVLEGGYGVGLQRGLVAFTRGLLGLREEYPVLNETPITQYRRTIESTRRVIDKVSSRVFPSGGKQ